MNEAVAVARQNVGSIGLGDLLALVGLPSQRRSTRELSNSAGEILRGIGPFIDELLLRAIAAQTKTEFIAARNEVFSPYAKMVTSLARLMQLVVEEPVIERVLGESFCELEADFREQGLTRFGAAANDQAMFTIWTLRRTSKLISKIVSSGPTAEDLRGQDRKLAEDFSLYATWTQFHLDCLLVAIRRDRPIQLCILPEIIDGLRAAVNAHGYARQGLTLRVQEESRSIQPHEWDEEDQELLDLSMRDMETQIQGDNFSWSEEEAKVLNRQRTVVVEASKPDALPAKPSQAPRASSPMFGTHIREAIDIIKDWVENPKPKQ